MRTERQCVEVTKAIMLLEATTGREATPIERDEIAAAVLVAEREERDE